MTTREAERACLGAFYEALFADPLLREFYSDSGYANFGYWRPETRSAAEAGDNLVDELVGRLSTPAGAILDVACGRGATTRRIGERLRDASLFGIGLSLEQLTAARRRAPTARFAQMDAARLAFDRNSFDAVFSIEAAFHFATRARFLEEALLVLKPGGSLLMSDLLMARGTLLTPPENHLVDARAYARLLTRVGFRDAQVTDVTDATWRAYRRHLSNFIARRYLRAPTGLRDLFAANVVFAWAVRQCVLVSAQKPSA
jgi:cyclopropane fatty-acyl-phospholipid synthase-like methyltransferase